MNLDHPLGEAQQVVVLGIGVEVVARVRRVAGLELQDGALRRRVGIPEREVERRKPGLMGVLAAENVDQLEEVDA